MTTSTIEQPSQAARELAKSVWEIGEKNELRAKRQRQILELIQTALTAAEQRGADRMRERTARLFTVEHQDERFKKAMEQGSGYFSGTIVEKIRALPLTEET
jgi:hypothetical protein